MKVKLSRESDESAFHSVIRENPLDPTPRLVYADWLEEHGDPTNAADHRFVGRQLQRYADEGGHLEDYLPNRHVGQDRVRPRDVGQGGFGGGHWIETHSGRFAFPTLADRHATIENADAEPDDLPKQNEPHAEYKTDYGDTVKAFPDGSAMMSERRGDWVTGPMARWHGDLNIDGQEAVGQIDGNTAEVARILVHNGDAFSGGSHRDAVQHAQDWVDFFHDPDLIERWVSGGYWNPAVAHEAMTRGYRPDDTPAVDRDSNDPVYDLCNHDVDFADPEEEDE